MNNNNLHRSLIEVSKEYEKNLKASVPKNSGDLYSSIKSVVNDLGFTAEALEYINYINEGVNGTEKSYGSIYSYTDKKPPISSLNNYNGINPYALQNSIYKNGIKPRLFMEQVENNIDINEILEGYSKDIDETLKDS